MRTDDLIAELAGRMTPVRPLRPPLIRALSWSAAAMGSATAAVLLFGARADLATRVFQLDFGWTLAAAVITSAVACLAALVLAVPGGDRTLVLRVAACSLVGIWTVVLGVDAAREGAAPFGDTHWAACFLRAIVVGLVPAVVLLRMIRRAAPLEPAWTGLFVGMAAAALGAVAAQIVCPIDSPTHALVGHLAPVIVMAALGSIASLRSA